MRHCSYSDWRKWRQARCSEGSLPIFNTYQQGVDIGILSVQPGSLVVIPLLPQCTIQTDMPFAWDSQIRINHWMWDVNNSKSCVISPPIDMEFGKFSSPLPLQLSEINSENNEIFNDSLNPFDVLGSNDPLTKLSFEELKIRNHKEFVRSELIESLGLSKEKMYYELLKPYKHRRIQSFDHKTQTHKYVYICTYENWDKEFTKGWNILDHVRMHENIKPYQWDGCERAFTQKWNLTKHYRRHLITRLRDRKRFFCQVCRKGFTERYNLKVTCYFFMFHTQKIFTFSLRIFITNFFNFKILIYEILIVNLNRKGVNFSLTQICIG